MAAVMAALFVGVLLGAVLRPFLDAYVSWKTARFYASDEVNSDLFLSDAPLFREPLS